MQSYFVADNRNLDKNLEQRRNSIKNADVLTIARSYADAVNTSRGNDEIPSVIYFD